MLEDPDLQWMPAVAAIGDIPTQGENLIIVANVHEVFHFRIFSAHGKKIVDADEKSLLDREQQAGSDEKRLLEREEQIAALRRQFLSLDVNKPNRMDKDRLIAAVTSLIDAYPPPMPVLACFARLKSVNGFRVVTVEGIAPRDADGRPLKDDLGWRSSTRFSRSSSPAMPSSAGSRRPGS